LDENSTESKRDGKLVISAENMGCDYGNKHGPYCAAERDKEIKRGQAGRMRLELSQLSVTYHTTGKQTATEKRH